MKNKDIEKKDKRKIVLSLLIAMAFILPATSAFGSNSEEADASDEQTVMKNIEEISLIGINGQPQPTGLPCLTYININSINLLGAMPVGDYEICVELEKEDVLPCNPDTPVSCDVKLFCDVFKLDPLPSEEMYCTDFEDMADIMNNWDSVDANGGPGGIDTWTWSDKRANSGTYSFKNTQFDDHYMGNQEDWLETKITNPDSKYEEITVTFMHWMEGELIDGGGYGDIPEDFGQIQYSTDHVNWFTVPTWKWIDEPAEIGVFTPQIYTSTDGWEEVTGEFDSMTGVSEFWLRFYWLSGPTIQNEGWYVDDVCVFGTYSPHPDFLFQTHSLGAIPVCDGPPIEYCFPTTWNAEEGTYLFEIWMFSETEYCCVEHPQSDKFQHEVEIGDFIELAVLSNSYPGGPLFDIGDNLLVTTTVTNLGTVNAPNVPVTFSVSPQIVTNHMMDYVEGTYYDPDDYDPYSDDAWDFGPWFAVVFGGSSSDGNWHITDEENFVSPVHAWQSDYITGTISALFLTLDDLGIDLADYLDAVDFDINLQINYDVGVNALYPMIHAGGWYYLSSAPHSGSTGGWVPLKYSDFMGPYIGPDEHLLQSLDRYFGIETVTDIGFFIMDFGGPGELNIDNIKVSSVVAGAEIYGETIIIPELECKTVTDPAEIKTLDFAWLDMPTGDYVEEISVPLDDPNPLKPINADNQIMAPPFSVVTDITEVDETEVEHMDLYEPEEVSHWHITTSGYDQYLWCGDEDTGTYGSDWDDLCYLVSDDNAAHDECPISMDWSDTTQVTLKFDEYFYAEDGWYDYGLIEINPHVSEPGSQWYYYLPHMPHDDFYDWTPQNLVMEMDDFFNDYIGDYLDQVEGTLTFTDDIGVRFRWISDVDWFRGWLLDNIEITYWDGVKYEENQCDDMTRLIADVPYPGDYWFEEPDPVGTGWAEGWTCLKRDVFNLFGDMVVPPDLNCALVWDTSVPQATSAKLWFDYDCNLNVGEDFCYLEFSTDGGGLWIAPVAFTGIATGTCQFDMSAFTGDDVLIRWRIITDDENIYDTPRYFHVENMAITGQVDRNPPVTTATISGTCIHGWFNTAVTFTATATDDVSGVKDIFYTIDGGSQMTYSTPISISVNGEHTVEFWSVDNVNNEETPHHTVSFKIDTGDGPSVSITAPTDGLYLFGNKLFDLSEKIVIIGSFTIEATASDVDSGIISVEFFLGETSIGSDTSSPYSILCGVKHKGAGTIKAVAKDLAGNEAQDTLDITYYKFL